MEDSKKKSGIHPPLSRRGFLKAFGATSALATGALLAACAPTAPQAPSESAQPAATDSSAQVPAAEATTAPAAAEGQPKSGGRYRIMTENDVQTLDAPLAFNYEDWWLSSFLIYNRLYEFGIDLKLFPALAADFPQISDDRLTYTIPLRKGIKFHDGQELTAEDVKFSFDRILDPNFANQGSQFVAILAGAEEMKNGAKELSGVKVIDPYTVSFTLTKPQSTFELVFGVATFGIVPKKAVEAAGADWGTKTVIGTGPYTLRDWKIGERLTFERFPDYWDKDGYYLDTVEMDVKIPPEQQVLRWENGEAEYAIGYPSPELARIMDDPNLNGRLRTGPTTIFIYLSLRNGAPLDDVNVRRAVAMAIDKQVIADKKRNARATDRLHQSTLPNFNPNVKNNYTYNPEEAKKLMAASQYKDGAKLSFYTFDKDLAESVQADLKEIGIEAEILTGDFAAFEPKLVSGEIQMNTNGDAADYPDPDQFYTAKYVCNERQTSFASSFCDQAQAVRDMLDQTLSLPLNSKERNDLLDKMESTVLNDIVDKIPIYERVAYGLGQPYIQGDVIHPIYGLPVIEGAFSTK
jgi:ABC-type transport system substrate-binding protein